jgi:polyphosphate kinase 2 (PPK2 family)
MGGSHGTRIYGRNDDASEPGGSFAQVWLPEAAAARIAFMGRLDELDLSPTLSRKEQERLLAHHGARLAQLRLTLGGQLGSEALGPALCVLFEGWDAGGKGGAIKRLVAPLDARHVRVKQFAAPTPDEKRHHYLHRFVPALPGRGGMAVLDRTWYGRVLVERVEAFASEHEWRRAYREIDEFERMLADDGMIIVKLWLHISEQEQLERFERRREDPLKAWKLTDEDWRNRDKRAAYEAAAEEMFQRTDTDRAPWRLIPADSKRYARVQVMSEVIEAVEHGCAAQGFPLPEPLEP